MEAPVFVAADAIRRQTTDDRGRKESCPSSVLRRLSSVVRSRYHFPQRSYLELIQVIPDGLGDEARRDRRAVVMHDRKQPARIDAELVDDDRAQVAVVVLVDDIVEVVLGDKARHAGIEREGTQPQPV